MLTINHLRKTYGSLVAVDDVSFAVEAGQLLGLLGPNGAGKTTTVSMIAGFATPDTGEVLIGGVALKGDTDPKKRKIGLVPQDLALYEELFAMANFGVDMLLERQRGLWKRLRSAPVSRFTLLAGKALSGAIISFLILAVCFLFAIVVFKVRIQGSIVGFLGVAISCSIMASTFGLLVAALGNSPATARGVTTLAVLMMVMLGGAWVPTFIFPAWLQQFTLLVPVRWAVDGLDATTWRGVGLMGVLAPIGVLLAFAAVFAAVAASRFKWEEA